MPARTRAHARLWVLAVAFSSAFAGCGQETRAREPSPPAASEGGSAFINEWGHLEAHNQRLSGAADWDGSLEGLRTLWHDNGVKAGEGAYENSIKVGPWTYWFEDGQRRWEGSYKNGEPHGLERAWYPDGQPHYEGTSRAGRRHGLYRYWYETGRLWWRGEFVDGVKEGLFEYRLPGGAIDGELSGRYASGKRVAPLPPGGYHNAAGEPQAE